MRFALHTDYALRTLMYLAARGGAASAPEIAAFFGVSKDHLAKSARRLAQAGFVRALRGAGGGLQLARSPAEIRIGDVVALLEGPLHLLDCVAIDDVCIIQPGCRLRGVLAEAERRMTDYLNTVTLSQLIPGGGSLAAWTAPAPVARAPRSRQPSGRTRTARSR